MMEFNALSLCYILILVGLSISPDPSNSAPVSEMGSVTFSSRDYVVSDYEYQQLLDRLYRESYNAVTQDSRDYLDENISVEEVVRIIEEGSVTATPEIVTTTTNAAVNDTTTKLPNLFPTRETERKLLELERPNQIRPTSDKVTTNSQPLEITTTKPECPICLESLDSKLSEITPCAHKFHKDCLKTWLHLTVSY